MLPAPAAGDEPASLLPRQAHRAVSRQPGGCSEPGGLPVRIPFSAFPPGQPRRPARLPPRRCFRPPPPPRTMGVISAAAQMTTRAPALTRMGRRRSLRWGWTGMRPVARGTRAFATTCSISARSSWRSSAGMSDSPVVCAGFATLLRALSALSRRPAITSIVGHFDLPVANPLFDAVGEPL